MPEIARTLAFISSLLMLMSFAVFANGLRGPLLQRLDGQRSSNAAQAANAIRFLMAAFGVSAVAAVLAIVGWIAH